MWFGTDDGLNKYDGYRFTPFKRDPEDPGSLSDNYIRALYEDRERVLWVGTNLGLNAFDRATGAFRRFLRRGRRSGPGLADDSIHAIAEDREGLLVGRNECGTEPPRSDARANRELPSGGGRRRKHPGRSDSRSSRRRGRRPLGRHSRGHRDPRCRASATFRRRAGESRSLEPGQFGMDRPSVRRRYVAKPSLDRYLEGLVLSRSDFRKDSNGIPGQSSLGSRCGRSMRALRAPSGSGRRTSGSPRSPRAGESRTPLFTPGELEPDSFRV